MCHVQKSAKKWKPCDINCSKVLFAGKIDLCRFSFKSMKTWNRTVEAEQPHSHGK